MMELYFRCAIERKLAHSWDEGVEEPSLPREFSLEWLDIWILKIWGRYKLFRTCRSLRSDITDRERG